MRNYLFENVRIETRNLIVRTLGPEDVEQVHSVVNQPSVMVFLPEDVMTMEEVRDVINWLQDCYRRNRPHNIIKWTLGIVWKPDSRIIGWCGIGPLDFDQGETEIFCGLSESHWGMGIAAEACRAVLDYAFQEIGLKRIVAVVNPENLRSVRLIEKLNMRLEKQVNKLPREFKHYEGFLYYSLSPSHS